MNLVKPHPIYSQPATVYVVTGASRQAALNTALQAAGFLSHLERHYVASQLPRSEFQIAIKPNIMTASVSLADSPVYTDPALVEQLIALIRSAGFTSIAVCEAPNVYSYSYQGRSVPAVARMVGYSGVGYRIVDLSDEKVPFDYGSVLGKHVVGRTWRDANYRISFAKNKTHWQCFYTGCIKNVYGCLPEWDKMKHYHGKNIEFFESAVLIADRFPVHFGLLDAWWSGDGFSGHVRDADPNETRTIFASDNIFALDWVAGEKMGLDPALNFVIQEAMLRWGTIEIKREGNLTPWYPWDNLRPIFIVFLDWLEEFYHLGRFFSRAMASEQDRRFPPVSRMQWLFGGFQRLTRLFEGLVTRRAEPPEIQRRRLI